MSYGRVGRKAAFPASAGVRRSRRPPGSRISPDVPVRRRRHAPPRVLTALRKVGAALDAATDSTTAMWATLVGLTAGDGLALNRAFLLLFDGDRWRAVLGVGPTSPAHAEAIWAAIDRRGVSPLDALAAVNPTTVEEERARHRELLARLSIPAAAGWGGWRAAFLARPPHDHSEIRRWATVLHSPALLVAPMRSAERPWGVLLADNFVTRAPIPPTTVAAAETLARGLRVALERTELFERLAREHRQRLAAEHAVALAEAAHGLAHDLKNPLALAGGLARELADAPTEDRVVLARQLRTIAAAVSRAEHRLADLADGIAARATEVAVEAVDIGVVCERIVDLFRPLALRRNVRLACYKPRRHLVAAAAPASLERCLENLIGNALQALSGQPGTIHVGARAAGEEVLVEVADDGPVLPRGLRRDPFTGGLTTRRGGSGLGLASVRRLVTAMGGRIEYDEKEPGWVRFTIYLRRWA